MRALRLMEWKSDPLLMEVDDPVPGPGQVVVRVGGAGACHSERKDPCSHRRPRTSSAQSPRKPFQCRSSRCQTKSQFRPPTGVAASIWPLEDCCGQESLPSTWIPRWTSIGPWRLGTSEGEPSSCRANPEDHGSTSLAEQNQRRGQACRSPHMSRVACLSIYLAEVWHQPQRVVVPLADPTADA